jgi:hypothetical protein
MVKVSWADGTILTVTIGAIGRPATRTLSARVDLTDDRSFLSDAHRDLVDALPTLSIHPGQPAGQGRIRVGVGAAACEIHVVLKPLPLPTGLVLGQCAAELLSAAAGDIAGPGG